MVMSLLQGGADRNQAGTANQTPVFLAAANGKQDIVQILLQADADVNLCNNEGKILFHSFFIYLAHDDRRVHSNLKGCSLWFCNKFYN